MKRSIVFFFFILYISNFCSAQDSTKSKCSYPLIISVYDNITSYPQNGISDMFKSPLHPGILIGTAKVYRKGKRSELFQTLKLSYFFHRYVQHGIQLYTELGYRNTLNFGGGFEVPLGLGYMHSIPANQKFIFKDGEYKKQFPFGRPQAMISLAPGIFYDFRKKTKIPARVFVSYQVWFQMPFVKSYVPILPNTSLHIGTYLFLNK